MLQQLEYIILKIGIKKYIQHHQKKKMSQKPFIIKSKVMQTMLPKDSDLYDEIQQSRIQVVQAINGYLTISMFYESFKLLWSFWHYRGKCSDFAYLSLGFLLINLIWGTSSYFGFRSIRSKNSRNITIFWYIIIVNLVFRIIMYIICGVVMKGYVPNYMDFHPEQLKDVLCNALYPEALYVISGVFECVICAFIIFLTNSIHLYVLRWENHETQKHMPHRYV